MATDNSLGENKDRAWPLAGCTSRISTVKSNKPRDRRESVRQTPGSARGADK
jgi:hypothetical protein